MSGGGEKDISGGQARIQARGFGVSLGGRGIIPPLDLDLEAGRFVVLLGPNGAGKTTLLRALAGLVPASGTLNLSALSRHERAKTLAYLPQGHQVHWPLSAREIVALGRLPHGLADPANPGAAHGAIIEAALARMDVLALADRAVTTLSGGERARVMMARVLAVEAPVLFADEPTAALDPRHQLGVMLELQREARAGKLVVAVTHDLTLAARLADDILLMHHGEIVARGTPEAALSPRMLAQVYGITAQRGSFNGEAWVLPWEMSA